MSWSDIAKKLLDLAENLPCPGEALTQLRFEFFLPLSYLSEAVDQLEYADIFDERKKMGMDYQVVVRSLERARRPNSQPAWHERWKQYRDWAVSATEPTIGKVLNLLPNDPEKLLYELRDVACVGLGCAAPDITQLRKLLSAGIPIALWVRSLEGADCQPAKVAEKVRVLIQYEHIPHLPTLVHQERRQADSPTHPGNHLTLLWDDPTRIPPDLNPSIHNRLNPP